MAERTLLGDRVRLRDRRVDTSNSESRLVIRSRSEHVLHLVLILFARSEVKKRQKFADSTE